VVGQRTLENVVRRLVVLTDVEREIEALVARGRNGHGPVPQPASESLREIARRGAREAERRTLKDVLDRVHWNRAEASRILKVSSGAAASPAIGGPTPRGELRPDDGPAAPPEPAEQPPAYHEIRAVEHRLS